MGILILHITETRLLSLLLDFVDSRKMRIRYLLAVKASYCHSFGYRLLQPYYHHDPSVVSLILKECSFCICE